MEVHVGLTLCVCVSRCGGGGGGGRSAIFHNVPTMEFDSIQIDKCQNWSLWTQDANQCIIHQQVVKNPQVFVFLN